MSSTAIFNGQSSASGCSIRQIPRAWSQSSIGGNVAECAGGPRAFKYGTTKRYVLALEAVLPTGEIVRTGSKAVKNVVGYDLTQLLVGSEGTLAIITQVTLRLIPKPPVRATLSAAFASIDARRRGRDRPDSSAVSCLRRSSSSTMISARGGDARRRSGRACRSEALVIVECDGMPSAVRGGARRWPRAARRRHARSDARASEAERDGAVERPPADLAGAARDRTAEDQPRRRRAARPGSAAVRCGGAIWRASSVCASRRSVTPATATSTSTSWWTRRRRRSWPRAAGRTAAVRAGRGARGIDQRRARHRLRQEGRICRSSSRRSRSRS